VNLQINKAVIPAGLIRSAKTYSLILNNEGLYIIKTGPAGREVSAQGAINKMVVTKVHEKIAQKVKEGEEKIQSMGVQQLVAEKGNILLTPGEIQDATVGTNMYSEPKLQIVSSKGKFSFHIKENSKEEMEEFVKKLRV